MCPRRITTQTILALALYFRVEEPHGAALAGSDRLLERSRRDGARMATGGLFRQQLIAILQR